MNKLRAILKISLLFTWTLIAFAAYLFGYGILIALRMPIERWRNRFMRFWSATICVILRIHITVSGTPPEPPFVLVSNHLSYIDIFPLYKTLDCTFVAKKEVRSWPVLGFMVMTMGVIFLNRQRKKDVTRVNSLVAESINDRQGVVIFPEGTTSAGSTVLPFRTSLLEIPATSGIPVHYAAIRYSTPAGTPETAETVCWVGGTPFLEHMMQLATHKRIECTIRFGETPVYSNDRKELAGELHEKMMQIFEPVE